MTSFICNSLISKPASRNKRLALLLLVSFCLTSMGQAFATPMMCMMPANSQANAQANGASPCHHTMSESAVSTQLVVESRVMDCCDDTSIGDDSSTISSPDCSCLDGGSGASLTFLARVSCSSLSISELPYHYSTMGFPNQIDPTLFRPPIA
ncbi:MAG: hypothetical protein ACI910_000754 [Oleispira sp.]|jgi:hypothetical protein